MEEDAEVINPHHVPESHTRKLRLVQGGGRWRRESRPGRCRPESSWLFSSSSSGIKQHNDDAENREHDFRQDANVVNAPGASLITYWIVEVHWPTTLLASCAIGAKNGLHRGIDGIQPQQRRDAHHQSRNGRRPKRDALAHVKVGQCLIYLVSHFAEEHSLVHPQQVTGAPDDARGAENSVDCARLECAAQHQKLTDKSVQQRQADRCQHNKQEKRRVHWHGRRQAAELGNVVGMATFVKNAGQHEQRRRWKPREPAS